MKILVTNDDGILAEGLWILAKELTHAGRVVVVAPDREQSAIGTAVTLSQPLRVQKVRPLITGVEAYAVQGTPGDSVILALEKLVKDGVGLVISGINDGLNLGNDVLISGTVSAALQGYLRGLPAIAISLSSTDPECLEGAARMVFILSRKIISSILPANIFLNVNLPDLPPRQIKGIRVTHLAGESHIDTVEEGHDGKRGYYWLVRQRVKDKDHDENSDIGTIEQGFISITPLHIYQDNRWAIATKEDFFGDDLCSSLFHEFQGTGRE